ncbi:hypothetical protein H4S04_008765 [Coemansia sp. S16]|nr:hypothetical protein H4S03_007897 [Coemansia sp. S3946]KAJ2036500.1 hypothetical protein H4S04_008765 [Coemansia sp. S16]KAJ2043559.1 hypothetical protein GGI08_007370 [Coemansia sp. S2]KAJ2057043.1 hypothetical protein GGH13_007417 [Coemansia sp. S155-1]
MKMFILSLVAIAVAPASLAAAISSVQQEEYQTIGFLNNFVASLAHMQTASPQCQGDCQGSGNEVTAVSAEEPQQPASINQISVLIREFVHPFQQAVESAKFAAVQGTPAIDMIYNYLNTPTFASPAAASPTPSLVNRLEANDLTGTAVPAGWWFAPASLASENAVSSAPDSPFAAIATFTAVPQADEEVEEVASVQSVSSFDYNSWGQRMDNAAIKMVRNVEGIIFEFIPSAATAQVLSNFEYDEAPESAATTVPAPSSWF